jgi:hypothetical protein
MCAQPCDPRLHEGGDQKVDGVGNLSVHVKPSLRRAYPGRAHWKPEHTSIHPELRATTHFGIFNPRLNTTYRIAEAAIPAETVAEVERYVIGYR